MTSISFNKLMDLFKNLKSDAVPRAPRTAEQVNNGIPEEQTRSREPDETQEEQEEEIVIEPEEDLGKKKKKGKKQYPQYTKSDDAEDVNNIGNEKGASSHANIQATGTVYNIMNSKHVRLGNDFYFGTVTQKTPSPASSPTKEKEQNKYDEEHIEKDNFISLLMEAKIKPDHDYLDYISKNLGKNWKTFFRALQFTRGRIETAEINAAGYDISEARYKLLLDWVTNDADGSLGRLSTLLWDEGERSIVKELSLLYRKSKK